MSSNIRTDGMIDADNIVARAQNPKSEHDYDSNTALRHMIAVAMDAKDAEIRRLGEMVSHLHTLLREATEAATKRYELQFTAESKLAAMETRVGEMEEALTRIARYPCEDDGPRLWVMEMMKIARSAIAGAGEGEKK
jgi:hypothetical protein